MTGIKILLVTSIIFIVIYFFIRLRSSVFDIIVLFILLITAVLFVIFPNITNQLAHLLGVGRGADLVFYLSIVIFWFIILKLYTRIRRLEHIITEIVRKDALGAVDQDGKRTDK
jgi:small membrane protein